MDYFLDELLDAMRSTARECLAYDQENGAEISVYHRERVVAEEIQESFEELIEKVEEIMRMAREEIEEARLDGEGSGSEDGNEDAGDGDAGTSPTTEALAADSASRDHAASSPEGTGVSTRDAASTSDNTPAPSPDRELFLDIDSVCMQIQDAGEKLEEHMNTVQLYSGYFSDYDAMLNDFEDMAECLREISEGLTEMVNLMPVHESDDDEYNGGWSQGLL